MLWINDLLDYKRYQCLFTLRYTVTLKYCNIYRQLQQLDDDMTWRELTQDGLEGEGSDWKTTAAIFEHTVATPETWGTLWCSITAQLEERNLIWTNFYQLFDVRLSKGLHWIVARVLLPWANVLFFSHEFTLWSANAFSAPIPNFWPVLALPLGLGHHMEIKMID